VFCGVRCFVSITSETSSQISEEKKWIATWSPLMAETSGFEELAIVFGDALERGSFYEFQRECDAMLLEKLQKGAFPVFGPSPLAAFVIRREMEIRHLKLLLAAKSAGVGQDRLRKRLPRG
ncbi:MAG: V-type ATPase subunit, partial [Candidatus Delongbacteria bacterium]